MDGLVDRNFDIRLVQTIEKYPVIYNTRLKQYNKPYYVRPAWEAIAKELNCDPLALKKKWTYFRANLSKNIKLRQMGEHVRKYYLYDHMKFVIPFMRLSSERGASHKKIVNEKKEREYKEEYDEDNRYQTDPEQNPHKNEIKGEVFQIDVDPIYFASHINDTFSPNTSAEGQTRRSNIVQNKSTRFHVASAATTGNAKIQFLYSILPDLNEMSNSQMRYFKKRVVQFVDEVLRENEN